MSDCKHDGQTGAFCNKCGAQLVDPKMDSLAEMVADKILTKWKQPSKENPKKTLFEEMFGK